MREHTPSHPAGNTLFPAAEDAPPRSGMPVPTTILYRRDGSVERELVGDVSEKRLGHYVGRIVRR